jgi:hypothetical protein
MHTNRKMQARRKKTNSHYCNHRSYPRQEGAFISQMLLGIVQLVFLHVITLIERF